VIDMIDMGSSRFARRTALVAVGAALYRFIGWTGGRNTGDRHGHSGSYVETPIVSDQPGVAPVTDANPVNPRGVSGGRSSAGWSSPSSVPS
jgi:hypothetical protein